MIVIESQEVEDYLREVDEFASSIGMADQFREQYDYLDTYANHGLPCIKGNNDWVDGVSIMKDVFHFVKDDTGEIVRPPQLRFFMQCVKTWTEHRKYAYAVHSRSSVIDPREAANKKDDHSCDCIRYLFATGAGPDYVERKEDEYSYMDVEYEEDPVTGY